MSEAPEQQAGGPAWAVTESLTDSLADAMHESWHLFRAHHPSGAYLPVGQLDGDCSYKTCGGSWPCNPVVDGTDA